MANVTFVANVTTTTSVDEGLGSRRITAYPNPATDYFELSNSQDINQIIVYSLLGKKVMTFTEVFDGKKYNIVDLPNGLYLISLINNDDGVVRTLRLSKRMFRP